LRFSGALEPALPVIVVAFVVAMLVALVATPLVRAAAGRRGLLDKPEARRVNTSPIPRGGGIAVVAAFVLVGGGFVLLSGDLPWVRDQPGLQPGHVVALFVGGLLAAIIGALDDLFDLRARWQLLGQLALAFFAVALGVTVSYVSNPFGPAVIPFAPAFGVAFTVLWIVGMINSINFIDGLDGLSSGIALIAAVTLGVLSLTLNVDQPFVAVLCFVLAGALLGFLRWNFQPASIFHGTSGVMFVGYALAVLSILGTAKIAVAVLVLGVPIIDTFWVVVRRLATGRSPFTPDRGHLHHRLLDLGLSHRGTVLLIYAICGILAVMSLVVSAATQVYAFLGALLGVGVLLFILAQQPREALEPTSYEDPDAG
jgi:UDP-GlcNAc:undecaprenyl-phosphate GlcNAc-1-phosphate transferase